MVGSPGQGVEAWVMETMSSDCIAEEAYFGKAKSSPIALSISSELGAVSFLFLLSAFMSLLANFGAILFAKRIHRHKHIHARQTEAEKQAKQ